MKDGETEILNPIENANGYIWASLSPNRQMILFNAVAVGTFVSDLNGNIIASLGYLNAAVWYNNEFVVGMQDKDDGQHITESAIILKNLAGNVNKKLSKSGMIAMFPTASSAGKKIAYNTTVEEREDIINSCITDLYSYTIPKFDAEKGKKSSLCRRAIWFYVIKHNQRLQKIKKHEVSEDYH